MTCLSRNDNQHKENSTKPTYTHARTYAAHAFSACDEQTTIDGFYSAVRRSNTNPIDALLSTLENVDGDLLPLVRLNMSTDGELSALSLFYGPTHSSYALLLWRKGDLQDGNHFVAVFPLNLPSTSLRQQEGRLVLSNLSIHLEHTGALSSCYCHLYISTLYYLPIDIMALTLWFVLYQRSGHSSFPDQWVFDLAECARSRDLRHAMTNFLVENYSQVWRSR